jgi:phosphatidylinositol alpha-mannosyltransferase
MKIGIVCPYSMSHAGGVQECVMAMQRELTLRGHVVRLITPRDGAADPNPGTIFIGQSKRVKTPQHTSMDVSVSVDVAVIDRVLEAEQFDLIHMHEPLVPFSSRQMLGRINVPVVGTFHAAMPETILARTIAGSIGPYVRSILKRLTLITAVSSAATSYIDHYEHKPFNFIPNGIDLDFYKPSAEPVTSKKKTILYIGRLESRKGVKYLLQAYQLLQEQHKDVTLVIAGAGADRKKLEKYAQELELKHIKFLGYVSQREKLRLLQTASVFCSPALFGESFGIVLLEAMATGLPVVAGDNIGYRAVLEGRGKLSLVNCEDSPALARQLELFLYDDAVRTIWKRWAAQHVKQFSYTKIVDQYEKIYQKALDGASE